MAALVRKRGGARGRAWPWQSWSAALLAGLAAAAGCGHGVSQPSPGSADLSRYAAVGNSITAGYQSGGTVARNQDAAYPVLLAQQFRPGAPFPHARISEPGDPSLLQLDWTSQTAGLLPFSIDTLPGRGILLNPTDPPTHNLGVPGARARDFFYAGGDGDYGLLLGGGSQWQHLKALHPSFVTFWLGANDALDAALYATPDSITDPSRFRADLSAALDSVLSTGAQVVVANIPDVEDIPFVTTVKPYFFDAVTGQPASLFGLYFNFLGPRDGLPPGPLDPGSLVTLLALDSLVEGVGLPTSVGGTGRPLGDDVVITPAELVRIRAGVAALNQVLAEECARRNLAVADMRGLFQDLRRNGFELAGVRYSTRYLFGGIFSLDGIHPTTLGQAIVADRWIDTINRSFGATIQHVDLAPFTPTPLPAGIQDASTRATTTVGQALGGLRGAALAARRLRAR